MTKKRAKHLSKSARSIQCQAFLAVLLGVALQSDSSAQTQAIQLRPARPAGQSAPAKTLVPATAIQVTLPATVNGAANPAAAQVMAEQQTANETPSPFSEEESNALKEDYSKLSPADRTAMVATYKDLGIDLLAALRINADGTPLAPANSAATAPQLDLVRTIQRLNFARTADKVLDARAKLGLKATPIPAADASFDELANWLHLQVLAGEWQSLQQFLQERAGSNAAEIYAHVLQSTNQGDPGLLPEEILAISEASPTEPTEWQLTLLAQLLRTAASRSSTGPLLERLKAGTKYFGPQTDGNRERTAKFLSEAKLAVEAFGYLPELEKARAEGKIQALLDHARYHEARGLALGKTPEAESHNRTAWDLYCEISLMESADIEQRRQSMSQAIELLPTIPPSPATAWLKQVFANRSLASTGLEAVALKAMKIGNEQISIEERASAILMMKDSVDALLADPNVELNQLRIPLRLLTLSLVAAAEETIQKQSPRAGVAPESALLLRALPSDQWRKLIEPSLAVRAYKAFIGVALTADNTDMALELLSKGIEQAPAQSVELADEFLKTWMVRLNPQPDPRRGMNFIMIAGRQQVVAAPLTRGRQERNLERLKQMLNMLDKIGANGRSLERVVDAFAACHGKAETYRLANVESILGKVDQLAPSVSARLAEAMRTGLNGDWRNRDVQQAEGNKRSESEIAALIEEGYALALQLIDSATRKEPNTWRYAMTKAALAYDHMQFRRQREQDAASYNASRQELFRAFGEAAKQYQAAVIRGELREDPGVYVTWFSISLGSSDLSGLTADDLLTEGAENNEQIELIQKQIAEMPAEMAASHLGEFARRVIDKLPSLAPEVKPGVVRRAAAIVGDHPAGAQLRQTLDLYQDLLSHELQLHLAIDGQDKVGTDSFGATLSLRYTAAISRELGGFDQYLQNNVYSYIGNRYQPINFRDRLQKVIEQAFEGDVELQQIGFFDSMNPPRSIQIKGEAGWEEKPLCYLVLKARDPSVDRLPILQLDVNTMDESGMVVLPVQSNQVLIDATSSSDAAEAKKVALRPLFNVQLSQTIDTRSVQAGKENLIKWEITATGKGVVPNFETLLPQIEKAVPGYAIDRETIEEEELKVLGVEANTDMMFGAVKNNTESDTYVEADANGVYRLPTSRRWTVTFKPEGGMTGKMIQVPKLAAGVEGVVRTERFLDMDLVEVSEAIIPVVPDKPKSNLLIAVFAALGATFLGAFSWVVLRAKKKPGLAEDALRLPETITPFSAVITLQRYAKEFATKLNSEDRSRLLTDIRELEAKFFASDSVADPKIATDVLTRWHKELGFRS